MKNSPSEFELSSFVIRVPRRSHTEGGLSDFAMHVLPDTR
jgi:hypothetical protein